MTVKNITKKKVLSDHAAEAKSLKDRTFGLIFEKNKKSLVLETRFGIHTHLMSKPIDVLILNKKNVVVKTKENLHPNRIFIWNPRFSKVIELPNKTIKKTGTRVGDRISMG